MPSPILTRSIFSESVEPSKSQPTTPFSSFDMYSRCHSPSTLSCLVDDSFPSSPRALVASVSAAVVFAANATAALFFLRSAVSGAREKNKEVLVA